MRIVDAKNTFAESDGVYFITGLIGLRAPVIFKRKFPGYVYVILLHVIYCYLFSMTIEAFIEMYETMQIYSKSSTARIFQGYLNPLFVKIMIISGVRNTQKINQTGTDLSIVDEKFKLINLRMDFTKLTRLDFARISEIIFWTIVFNLIEYFPQTLPGTTQYFVFVWIINSYPQFVNSIAIGSFAIFMTKIRRRFEAINEVIPTMKIFQKNSSSNLETDMNNVFRLRLINKTHEKLVNAATNLNEAYGFLILTSFTIYFVTCCFYLRSMSLTFDHSNSLIDMIVDALWLIFYFGKYVYVIDTCHRMTLQAKLAGRLLREKWTDVDHHPLKQETELLVRQIEGRNLQLTAYNFFVIDYAALKMIIVALAAYLIVVSQPTASCDENQK